MTSYYCSRVTLGLCVMLCLYAVEANSSPQEEVITLWNNVADYKYVQLIATH